MSIPKVSIIILNWNGKKFLKTCLDSLRKQTLKDFEVILVDNGSIDGSQEFIERNFPEVKLIELDKNYGVPKALNIGIIEAFKNSKVKYVTLLNNDTKAEPNWIEELMKVVDSPENEKVGIFSSKILLMDRPQIFDSAGLVFKNGYIQERGHGKRDRGQFDHKPNIVGASGAASLYKREMLDEIGLLREEFFGYYEDSELAWRAWRNGWKARFVPSAVIYHKGRATTYQNEKIARRFKALDYRNLVWTVKNYGTYKNKILLTLVFIKGMFAYWIKVHKIKADWRIKLNYKSIIDLWS